MALLQIAEPGMSTAPHQHRLAVGIDLGTTNSLVATVRSGSPEVLSDEEGRSLLPSIVRYLDNGHAHIGRDLTEILERGGGLGQPAEHQGLDERRAAELADSLTIARRAFHLRWHRQQGRLQRTRNGGDTGHAAVSSLASHGSKHRYLAKPGSRCRLSPKNTLA